MAPLLVLPLVIAIGFALCFGMKYIQLGGTIREINTLKELRERRFRVLRNDAIFAVIGLVLVAAAGWYYDHSPGFILFGYAFGVTILSGSLFAELYLIRRQAKEIGMAVPVSHPATLDAAQTSKTVDRIGRGMMIFAVLNLAAYALWSVELMGVLPNDLNLSLYELKGPPATITFVTGVLLATTLFLLGMRTTKGHRHARRIALIYAIAGIVWTVARFFVPELRTGAAAWLCLPLAWYGGIVLLFLPRDWQKRWCEQEIDQHQPASD